MINDKLEIFLEESFYALTTALAVFGVLEMIKPHLVLAYVDLGYLLLAWLIIGIILLGFSHKNK